jgi:hypothetical protein
MQDYTVRHFIIYTLFTSLFFFILILAFRAQCNIIKLRFLSTECICVFHMVLTVNDDYLPKHN